MADPLTGVYKARQSPRFVAGCTPHGARRVAGASEFRAWARFERIAMVEQPVATVPDFGVRRKLVLVLVAAAPGGAMRTAIGRGSA
jgi:hypothetical protein